MSESDKELVPPLKNASRNNSTAGNEKESEINDSVADENKDAEEKMKQFAVITGTDEIQAQVILQDVNWNLESALEVFYGSEAFSDARKKEDGEAGPAEAPKRDTAENFEGLEISLMSWNIDGLDGRSLSTRMKAVQKIVTNVNADFVFLQEVVDREIDAIERLRVQYDIYYSNRGAQYYTAILVSKMFSVESHRVVHFQNSGMGRTLQILEGSIGPMKVFLLNTHLESMREHSAKRCTQLNICLDNIRELIRANPDSAIFFGGDLNIRDDEMVDLPVGVKDSWIAAGSDSRTKFTWDMRQNDNKQAGAARLRFDRIFWYATRLRYTKFSLEGRQRIRSCLCFPSDHWAACATFS